MVGLSSLSPPVVTAANALVWHPRPFLFALIAAVAGVQARGLYGVRRLPRWRWRAAACGAGYAVLLLVLVSPVDSLTSELFVAHAAQHSVLALVVGALLALGCPAGLFVRGLPARARIRLLALARGRGGLCSPGGALASVAWLAHVGSLLLVHVPAVYHGASANPFVHAAVHLGLVLSAWAFWAVLIGPWTHQWLRGWTLVYALTAALAATGLGAILTFAPEPMSHAAGGRWGLSSLEDQQLGALALWAPAAAAYVLAGTVLLAVWMRVSPADVPPADRIGAWREASER